MTEAARQRRALRRAMEPLIIQYHLNRSSMRFVCTPAQMRAAAKKIAIRSVSHARRVALKKRPLEGAGMLAAL